MLPGTSEIASPAGFFSQIPLFSLLAPEDRGSAAQDSGYPSWCGRRRGLVEIHPAFLPQEPAASNQCAAEPGEPVHHLAPAKVPAYEGEDNRDIACRVNCLALSCWQAGMQHNRSRLVNRTMHDRESKHRRKIGSGSGREWPMALLKADMITRQPDAGSI